MPEKDFMQTVPTTDYLGMKQTGIKSKLKSICRFLQRRLRSRYQNSGGRSVLRIFFCRRGFIGGGSLFFSVKEKVCFCWTRLRWDSFIMEPLITRRNKYIFIQSAMIKANHDRTRNQPTNTVVDSCTKIKGEKNIVSCGRILNLPLII